MTDAPPPTPPPTPSPTPSPTPPAGARRAAAGAGPGRRRIDPVLVVAVVVVLVAAGLAWSTRTDPTTATTTEPAAPGREAVTRTSLVCPSTGEDVRAATATEESGPVVARSGGDARDVALTPRRVARVPAAEGDAVVLRAEDALAPGLVAARLASPAAVAACTPPAFDQWFTGVGAGPEHASVLELTNPDGGRAIVDVTVLGRNGTLDVPRLQGLAVGGNQTVRLDLAELVPRREDLTVRVETSRGRVSSALEDRVSEVGAPALGPDWLVPQAAPATTNVVLGLPPGDGDRLLTLANPGPDEGRAQIEVVTATSVFAPDDAPEVVVPPQSTVQVAVGDLLASTPGPGGSPATDPDAPLGLRVSATVPVTAAVRSLAADDVALSTAGAPTDETTAALLPGGAKQLVIDGASDGGVVEVRTWSGRGRALPAREVDVEAGRASTLDLPGAARLVVLTPSGTPVTAALVSTTDGAAVVVPREVPDTEPVPQVVPGAS